LRTAKIRTILAFHKGWFPVADNPESYRYERLSQVDTALENGAGKRGVSPNLPVERKVLRLNDLRAVTATRSSDFP